jgi:hypothetical protein
MRNASPKLEAAYVHFAHQVGALLESKGATHDHGHYTLATPGGSLILWPQRNWIFGRFENPVGGFIVTRGLSQEHSGRWHTNFHDNADALTAENLLRGFEYDLDQVLGFTLTDEQSQAIACEAEARARLAAIVDAVDHDADSVTVIGRIQAYERTRLNLAGAETGRFRADGTSTPRPMAS